MRDESPKSKTPPNIIILVLDTARARNFSSYGHDNANTNNIAKFAKEGVLFKNAISVSPWTLPSHASLFTGVPPTVHQTNGLNKSLPDSLHTLAETLSNSGYRTVGMSANPWFSSQFGITKGFDEFHNLFGPLATDSYREFVKQVTDSTEEPVKRFSSLLSKQSPTEIFKNGITAAYRHFVGRADDGGKEAVKLSHEVIEGKEPYFLFVNFLEPHLPYEPPENYVKSVIDEYGEAAVTSVNQDAPTYNVRNVKMSPKEFEILEALYDAELNYVDKCIGKILNKIKLNDQEQNSLIAILGDHGENIGDHGMMSHHYSVNHTLLHVPMIVRYPGSFDSGEKIEKRVSSLDLPATIDSILQTENVDTTVFGSQQQGISLQEPTPDRSIIAEYLNPMPPISQMREKCNNPDFDVSTYDRSLRALYKGKFKLITGSDGSNYLYNIFDDPSEDDNLIEDNTRLVVERKSELNQIVKQYKSLSRKVSKKDITQSTEDRLQDLGYL